VVVAFSLASPLGAQNIWISFVYPKDGDFVIGELDVEVEVVSSAGISEVEFQLDGRPIGTLDMEPFRLHVDLGEKNLPHRFSVVARTVEGDEIEQSVMTQPMPISADYEVELRQLYVSVTRGDERVLDLDRESFTVIDEGDSQELVTFARGDIPFTAVLLIDASASMFGQKIESAVAGAASFVQGMKELDQAQVMVFSDQVLSMTPITDAKEILTAGLSSTDARGGTALQDHLFVGLTLVTNRQGRRVLILLSDGIDTHSVVPMSLVFDVARKSNVLIYWIRFSRDGGGSEDDSRMNLSSAWKNPDQYREEGAALAKAVNESGGRIFHVARPDKIRPVFIHILNELRDQYVLGYYPNNKRNDGRWHRVKVGAEAAEVEVRAPRGYVDHGPGGSVGKPAARP
jgi:Ca-activated chloride channel family protein